MLFFILSVFFCGEIKTSQACDDDKANTSTYVKVNYFSSMDLRVVI